MKRIKEERMRYSKPMVEIIALKGNCLMNEASVDYGDGKNNPIKLQNPKGDGDYDDEYGENTGAREHYNVWEEWE